MGRGKKPYVRYAQDVVSGRVVAGEYIRKACQRFLSDMKRKDIQLRYRVVDDCIAFIGLLKHTTGKFSGHPFRLQPWQQWVVANIVGWYVKATGTRRFTQSYIEMSRKQGKTALVAAISLYALIADGEDIDHVVGYIHSSDMFQLPPKVEELNIRTLPFVPETMAARKLMHIFLQQKKSLAIVVDEFGGTSGLVSLEDIVEEIFGDIEDEHDTSRYVAKQLENDEYVLSARLEIEKVNEMFGLDLPESDEYMTIGGLILHEYQSFPKLNEVVKIGHFEFKIVKNTMTKIELVRLKITE